MLPVRAQGEGSGEIIPPSVVAPPNPEFLKALHDAQSQFADEAVVAAAAGPAPDDVALASSSTGATPGAAAAIAGAAAAAATAAGAAAAAPAPISETELKQFYQDLLQKPAKPRTAPVRDKEAHK